MQQPGNAHEEMQRAMRERALLEAIDGALPQSRQQQQRSTQAADSGYEVPKAALERVRKAARAAPEASGAGVDALLDALADPDDSRRRHMALCVLDDLVVRSHRIRCLVVEELDVVLERCVGHRREAPLPPPREWADTLRQRALEALVRWAEKFGASHRRLGMALRHMRCQPNVVLPEGPSRHAARDVETEAQAQMDAQRQAEAARALSQRASRSASAARQHASVMERCFALLSQGAPARGIDSDGDDSDDWEDGPTALAAGVAQPGSGRATPAYDPALLAELASLCREAQTRRLPEIAQMLTEVGRGQDAEDGTRALVDAKATLEALVRRCMDVGATPANARRGGGSSTGTALAGDGGRVRGGASGRGGAPVASGSGWVDFVATTGRNQRRRVGGGPQRAAPGADPHAGAAALNVAHNDLALSAARAVAQAGGDTGAAEAQLQYEADRAAATAMDAQRALEAQAQEVSAARGAKRKKSVRDRLKDRLMTRQAGMTTAAANLDDATIRARDRAAR